jgi:hypothetical protein
MANEPLSAKQFEQLVSAVEARVRKQLEGEECPTIIGRCEDESLDPRASTERVASLRKDFHGAVCGDAWIHLFESTDYEDRGGVVIGIEIRNRDGAFIPHAESTPDGIEIHLAGDAEAAILLDGLRTALDTCVLRAQQSKKS